MQIPLQGYVNALEQAESRRTELDAQIRELLPSWSLARIVTALQALRGVASVSAVALVAEIGDFSRFSSARDLMAYFGLCSRRALEWIGGETSWNYKARQFSDACPALRGCRVLPTVCEDRAMDEGATSCGSPAICKGHCLESSGAFVRTLSQVDRSRQEKSDRSDSCRTRTAWFSCFRYSSSSR